MNKAIFSSHLPTHLNPNAPPSPNLHMDLPVNMIIIFLSFLWFTLR